MVLGSLFEKTGLEQDTGRISERWGQDGSAIVNGFNSGIFPSGENLRTTTNNKTFYVKSISGYTTSINSITLQDGDGGPTRFTATNIAIGRYEFIFVVPLFFEVSMFGSAGGDTINISFVGWEE